MHMLYQGLLSQFAKRSFPIWQRLGLHVTLNHFYQPIPDTTTLNEELWRTPSALVGVDMQGPAQVDLLAQFRREFSAEYESFPERRTAVPHQYYTDNMMFVAPDAVILYCMIRKFKPARVFEIGSGFSTFVSAQALRKNAESGFKCELHAFEPYPSPTLQAGFPGLTALHVTPAQKIPSDRFAELGENDILFIDSSHMLKIGSDVQYLGLEIIPRLNRGVLVHLHDIFLPAEYPRFWVKQNYWFYNEQYWLQAFLAYNSCFRVHWAGNWMHLNHSEELKTAISSYARDDRFRRGERLPGSFWMQRVA